MTDRRIHEYLDGDRPVGSLSAEECIRAAELEESIFDVTRAIRSHPAPDLTGRVMAALPAMPDPVRGAPVRRLLQWLWSPKPIRLQLRPMYGLAAAGLVLALGLALSRTLERSAPTVEGSEAAFYVQFRFESLGASRVALAGSFTEWEPRFELRQSEPGVWSALVPLKPGVHDYTFVVDGTDWVADPHAFLVDDSFGGTNSRITLLPPTSDN